MLLISFISLFISPSLSVDITITCQPAKHCTISHLNSSETNIINARNATSLVLNCHEQSCKRSEIQCPNGPCNIVCHDEQSCEDSQISTYPNTNLSIQALAKQAAYGIIILGDNTNEINLFCQADESCEHAFIHDPNIANLNVFCATRSPYHESCAYMKIHAENADSVNIDCGDAPGDDIASGSCQQAQLYLDNANTINIIAYDIQYGIIKAQNANRMNMTCVASFAIHEGCYKTEIWFPNTTEEGVNTFNCYGSCRLLGIHDIKCGVFDAMNVNLNGCGLTHNAYNFIDQWSFWYNGKQNALYSFQNSFGCGPWQDHEFISECNCSDVLDIVYDSFIDDAGLQECDVFGESMSSTSVATTNYYTTTSNPTQYPSQSPSKLPSEYPSETPTVSEAANAKDNKQWKGTKLLVVIIVPVAVGLIVIGFIILFVRKKCVTSATQTKHKHQKVRVSDNEEEAEYDMETVPIATQVQMESPFATYN